MAARVQKGVQAKPIKCDQCGKGFPANVNEKVLVHHIKTAHNVTELEQSIEKVSFKCPFCDSNIVGLDSLRTHKKTHKKKYKCDKCEKEYTTQGSLTVHKAKEHEGKRYPCDYCDHQAKEAGALQIHLDAIHNGILYKCHECPFESTSKYYVKQHEGRKQHINTFL